ncbi:hypothetical protein Sj15T_19440 [Sphingobium sp. TA15]|uniref:DUF2490 domain-containing protein n=1 Tax=Sphingobium indicum (strain DSM 16413 / CCM 7287 / MTCC 6362 / UT26 / NBRC 101211 / UT26S) TaxID=452662 RepID=D4Z4H9_SPHIU|nr:DUF2490 domain-containing protein [Sphingobium indicum]BAI97511.1 hypothetical protein SJA_C1-26770 [Sphingobium indicum UT26S]BDD66923.1 hypothetical protein Sj15T_19440 [Sphingobium sp. TA15]
MLRRQRPRHISDALIPVGLLAAPPALAANPENQFWMTESLVVQASDADIVSLDLSQRFRKASSNGEQQTVRVLIDHRIAKAVQVGGGLAYFRSGPEQEMRLFQQVTLTKGVWVSRTRIEQRFFDTADGASWRLRQRAQASVPLDAAKRWTLIAAAEFMFHLNRARPGDRLGLAVLRNQIGLRHPIGKALDAQLLYMRQQTFRDGRPDAVAHIPWLTLSWRI